MSTTNVRLLLPVLLILSVCIPAPALAKAGTAVTDGEMSFTFADLGERDITVTAIYDQEFIDFPVPDGRKISRAVLRLHMQHSPSLLATSSDIVIGLNNEPAANVLLAEDNSADETSSIELPVEALQPGENELLLRINQRLVENGCSDVGDSNLWVKIFADSSISFSGEETPNLNDLSQFPLPFSTFAALPGSPQVDIVLPPAPTSAELSAAARIAASLGQEANWKNPPLTAFSIDQADQNRLALDTLIVLNTGKRNSLAAAASPGLTVSPSPYDPNKAMLIVSGANDADLLRSVSMLTTRSARSNLTGTHAEPADVTPRSAAEHATQSKFSELGLTTKRARGIGRHDLYYPINIPYDWKTTSETSVEVHFTHGAAISSASLMTIYINGFETANARLDRRNDEDGRLVIQLSPRQIHPGRNWLHFVFDLHMARENCKFRYFEEAWAQVSAEQSLVNLAHVVSSAPLDLHYMPSYLVIPNDLSADLIVLPASPSIEDLTAMVRIAAKLGTYSSEDTVRIQAVAADRFSPQSTPTNVIAIGSPETNALIHTYDVQLPQPLSPVNGQVVSAPGRELSPEEQAGQAGYLEVMPSPWSRSDSFLVIGAHTPGLLLRVVDILPTGGTPMKQQGNVAVVTPTTVTGFSLGNFAGASLSSASRKAISQILIGAFFLIGLLGGLAVWRRRRGQAQKNDEQK